MLVRAPDGRGAYAFMRNIASRKMAEALAGRASVLALANLELDSYASTVAHDLKAPLRAIRSFSQFLREGYAKALDDEGREYLERLIGAGDRLQGFVDSLLRLSRVSREEAPRERVPVREVVSRVLDAFEGEVRRRRASVFVAENLPEVWANPVQVEQIFSNLLSNALKFNETEVPVIAFGAGEGPGGMISLHVRDNGIGIEAPHLDRVFEPFTRLHPREKFEGSGAGLAIVRKIVEAHGGRAWAESQPSHGTTIHFTLPAVPSAAATSGKE